MADRYCPYCGELVPSNSVTCPKCYRKIPDEPGAPKQSRRAQREKRRSEDRRTAPRPERNRTGSRREYSRQLALALNVIPGFFGLLGLGQIYRDYKSMKGWFILLLGLVLFTTGMMLMLHVTPSFAVNFFSSLSAFPIMLLYALLYIFAALDTLVTSVFRIGFR